MLSSHSTHDVKSTLFKTDQKTMDTERCSCGAPSAPIKSQRHTHPLQALNDPIKIHTFPHLDNKSLAAFARSSTYARKLAKPELDRRALKKLFEHIREGDIDKAKTMLKCNPTLASTEWKTQKGEEKTIANKAGQRISIEGKTAYEFALGEEDTEMAAELRTCIVNVASQEAANKLFYRQFPPLWEEKEAIKSAPIFAQLNVVNQAIRNALPRDITSSYQPLFRLTINKESATGEALFKLRSMIDAMRNETVTTGRHFDPNLLLSAFRIYDTHYLIHGWDSPRAMAFWQQAIGFIQRLMPASYVQAFIAGPRATHKNLKNRKPQGRSLEIDKDAPGNPTDLYPRSQSRLGYDFAMFNIKYQGYTLPVWPCFGGTPTVTSTKDCIEILMAIKKANLQNLLYKTLNMKHQAHLAL